MGQAELQAFLADDTLPLRPGEGHEADAAGHVLQGKAMIPAAEDEDKPRFDRSDDLAAPNSAVTEADKKRRAERQARLKATTGFLFVNLYKMVSF